jgi:Zn-dependent protease with chaperone function
MCDYLLTSYAARLVCFSLAFFFLIDSFAALAVWLVCPAAIRWTTQFRPQLAARFVLALRLLPCGLAIFAVFASCVPSYFSLEPQNAYEQMNFSCDLIALLGITSFGFSMFRAWRVATATRRYVANYLRRRRAIDLSGANSFTMVESEEPILAVEGVLKARILVSRRVLRELPQAELKAALAHETCHIASRDNLKRLLILLAPDALLFGKAFAALDQAWAQFAEWSADDWAANGDPVRATLLASALVRLSRMGLQSSTPGGLFCFVSDAEALPTRVNRLLSGEGDGYRQTPRLFLAATVTLIAVAASAMLQPSCWYAIHELLERMVR